MLLTFGEVDENPRFSSPVTYMIIQKDGTQLVVYFFTHRSFAGNM